MSRCFRIALFAAAVFTSAPAAAQVTALRINDLDLRDPHVFVNPFGSLCVDMTDTPFAGFSVNGQLQTAIVGDANPADGFLDLSTMLLFDPLDQGAPLNVFDAGSASLLGEAIKDVRLRLDSIPTMTATWSTVGGTHIDFSTAAAVGEFQYLGGAQVILSTDQLTVPFAAPTLGSNQTVAYRDDGGAGLKRLSAQLFGLDEFHLDSSDGPPPSSMTW